VTIENAYFSLHHVKYIIEDWMMNAIVLHTEKDKALSELITNKKGRVWREVLQRSDTAALSPEWAVVTCPTLDSGEGGLSGSSRFSVETHEAEIRTVSGVGGPEEGWRLQSS
jgi:hypothetical protein